MRVMITGALGVNGAPVAREFVRRGIEPVLVDAGNDHRLLSDLAGQVKIETLDIRDTEGMRSLLTRHRIRVLIHLAALMPGAVEDDVARGLEVNTVATRNLANAAGAVGVERFLYASTRGVYGAITDARHVHPVYEPLDERAPCLPASSYDVTKFAGERFVKMAGSRNGMEVASLRFATIFAPGKGERHGKFALHSQLIAAAMREQPMSVEGGDQCDDVIYVGDVARAVSSLSLVDGNFAYDVYNVSAGRPVSMEAFVKSIGEVMPWAAIEVSPGLDYASGEVPRYAVLSNDRLVEQTGEEVGSDLTRCIEDFCAVSRQLGV